MATIVKDGMTITLGRDFADAVLLPQIASHGELQVNNKARFTWQSTLSIAESERALRLAALEDGVRITLFVSQAGAS